MKSKEALKRIYNDATALYIDECEEDLKQVEKDYNIIKQDLDRLKKLNEVWHKNEPMESVDINANHLQDTYEVLSFYLNRCEILENNIKKLFKVIEILKDKNVDISQLMLNKDLYDYNRITRIGFEAYAEELTKEEYELLKEVLWNEK